MHYGIQIELFLVLILQYGGASVHRILSLYFLFSFVFLCASKFLFLFCTYSLFFCVNSVSMSKEILDFESINGFAVDPSIWRHKHAQNIRFRSSLYFRKKYVFSCVLGPCVNYSFLIDDCELWSPCQKKYLNPSMFVLLILQYGGTSVHWILCLSVYRGKHPRKCWWCQQYVIPWKWIWKLHWSAGNVSFKSNLRETHSTIPWEWIWMFNTFNLS